MNTDNTDPELRALVARAVALRSELKSRTPYSLPWRFNDFVLGTAGFTWPQRGAYMALLFRQFSKGACPTSPAQLAALADMPGDEFETLWQTKLAEKFSECDGQFYNRSMLIEWIGQAEYLMRERDRKNKGRKAEHRPNL